MSINSRTLTGQKSNNDFLSDRLLRWSDVAPMVGICRSHAHQLAAKGLFPRPRKLVPNGRASAWVESEILEWVQQRIADTTPDSSDAA